MTAHSNPTESTRETLGQLSARFWSRAAKQTEPVGSGLGPCWEWRGSLVHNGYGRFYVAFANGRRRTLMAHRVAWMLTRGQWPDELVCHRCDNRKCVNPEHLFLGDQTDNLRDMREKGRQHYVRGARHGMARLSEQEVREIRAATVGRGGCTLSELGRRFGVKRGTVRDIRRRKIWRHVA